MSDHKFVRKHSTATAEEIAAWTLKEPTEKDIRDAEKRGRELAKRQTESPLFLSAWKSKPFRLDETEDAG